MTPTPLSTNEIRTRFLAFFAAREHAVIASAPLVPRNDPSVLFNTAGMQPLVPYLMGAAHPQGKRIASCQKCVRTGDIDEVGDPRHLTFFEMLGNWSLGDYFKPETIAWSYEFLTSKAEGLGLDPARLYVTVFEGDDNAPRDLEAYEIWKNIFITAGINPEGHIFFLPAKNNWWSPGDNGPCGPDTEMFYDVTADGLGDLTHEAYLAADDAGQVVEIWNDVFMQYEKKNGVVVGTLAQHNVDTGSGLERIAMVVQGKSTVYETDLFSPIIALLVEQSGNPYEAVATPVRIVADHLRSALFLLADGVFPSNKDQGYVLRRLIRRAVLQLRAVAVPYETVTTIITAFIAQYGEAYPELIAEQQSIIEKLTQEIAKFQKTLEQGVKLFEKGTEADLDPFILATTYGFPIELTLELAKQKGWTVDRIRFEEQMAAHQALSRAGAEQKFKGGLANTSDMTVRLHTAHHLLLKALQEIVSPTIHQKGSNITEERLRIDFNFDRKLTDEEKQQVEAQVNAWIAQDLLVVKREMPRSEAEQLGAEMEFGTVYPDIVSVYSIEDAAGQAISKEFCGGPHVPNTKVLGTFKLLKEEAVAAGVRRIKATLV